MRKVLILFILTFCSIGLKSQLPVLADSIYNFIKRNSIHSNDVNWLLIDKGFKDKLKSAQSDLDSLKSFVYVFGELKDYHSSISFKGQQFSNYPDFDEASLKYLVPLVNLSNQKNGLFTAKIIEGKYLYLQVPGIQAWGDAVSSYAQKLSDTLCKYYSAKIKGIVLDLRLNDGGQFSSMASGLAPLLGENYLGGGINNEQQQVIKFKIKNGNLWINENPMTSVKHKIRSDLSKLPVAVLIGPNTRSSGSILGISFKGRTNTKIFGDSTANGYTTSNDYFTFSNNLFLNLSTCHSIDRNNKVYKYSFPPDVYIRGEDNFILVENDIKVKEALKWLKNGH